MRTQASTTSLIVCDTASRCNMSKSGAFPWTKLLGCWGMRDPHLSILLSRAGRVDQQPTFAGKNIQTRRSSEIGHVFAAVLRDGCLASIFNRTGMMGPAHVKRVRD